MRSPCGGKVCGIWGRQQGMGRHLLLTLRPPCLKTQPPGKAKERLPHPLRRRHRRPWRHPLRNVWRRRCSVGAMCWTCGKVKTTKRWRRSGRRTSGACGCVFRCESSSPRAGTDERPFLQGEAGLALRNVEFASRAPYVATYRALSTRSGQIGRVQTGRAQQTLALRTAVAMAPSISQSTSASGGTGPPPSELDEALEAVTAARRLQVCCCCCCGENRRLMLANRCRAVRRPRRHQDTRARSL